MNDLAERDASDKDGLILWAKSRTHWLRQEADSYCLKLDYFQFRKMLGLGANVAVARSRNIFGFATVEELSGDRWQPSDTGTRMATVTVFYGADVVDIVAFEPSNPSRWLLRTGDGWALGADAIAIKVFNGEWEGDEPLPIHATPFDWLKSDMKGCCVINWTDEARQTLRQVDRISSPSARYAQALRLELTRPPALPEIIYPGSARHAA
jgi:hypothetical protein